MTNYVGPRNEWKIRVCPICGGDGIQLAHGRCVNGCRDENGIIPPLVEISVMRRDSDSAEGGEHHSQAENRTGRAGADRAAVHAGRQ